MTGPDFAALLAGIRVRLPMREVAAMSGLSRVTLWRIETGQVRNPSHDAVERLLKLARLDPQGYPQGYPQTFAERGRSVSPMKPKRA
jgi:transcriptional regulator with XRE-family HTH domain